MIGRSGPWLANALASSFHVSKIHGVLLTSAFLVSCGAAAPGEKETATRTLSHAVAGVRQEEVRVTRFAPASLAGYGYHSITRITSNKPLITDLRSRLLALPTIKSCSPACVYACP